MVAQHDPFAGTTAIVTGGASGIGRAIGAELVRRGGHVVLVDIDGAGAAEAAATLSTAAGRGAGGSARGRALDVRDAEAFTALVADEADRAGSIDLLFNNAGISI